MLNSNAICLVCKNLGTDVYGQAQLGDAVSGVCAIVRLRNQMQHTTVRADSSQSRGAGDEFTSSNKILIPGTTAAVLGDQLTVQTKTGVTLAVLKIVSMHPRLDAISGRIDHFEVEGEPWGS